MWNKLKLAPKLGILLGGVLAVAFTVLIVATSSIIGTTVRSAVGGELETVSRLNAAQLQSIFTSVEQTAVNMKTFLEGQDAMAKANPSRADLGTSIGMGSLFQSEVFPTRLLSPLNHDMEVYMLATARGAVKSNPDVAGMGVLYAPYKFQANLNDYAFYMDRTDPDGTPLTWAGYADYSATPYYQGAAQGRTFIGEPMEEDGTVSLPIAVPIAPNGTFTGAVIADVDYASLSRIQTTNDRYPSMLVTVYDANETAVYDVDPNGTPVWGSHMGDYIPVEAEMEQIRTMLAAGESFRIETTQGDGSMLSRFFTPISVGEETWWSLTAVATSDLNKTVTKSLLVMVSLSLVALAVLVAAVVLILRRMLRPLGAVVQAATDISQGKLDIALNAQGQDEIGILSATFQQMVDTLHRMLADVQYLLGEMAEGNFSLHTQAEDAYVGEFEGLIHSIRKLKYTLSGALTQILQTSDQVAAGSDQVSSGAQALSQGASEQASSVEELAATINDISTQLTLTAENARQARETTNAVGSSSNLSTRKMEEMLEAMADIRARSAEIAKIVKTIEDIAFQTNILALNAAVEAARAGAAGKGFAVVADEVRNLASKSAEASKNTSDLIQGSLSAVERGTRIADETAQALGEAVRGVEEAERMINLISSAAGEQAGSISQVTMGIDMISSVVQTTAATAEESAAASEELSGQSQLLKDLVGKFTLENQD